MIIRKSVRANDFSSLNPQLWADEALLRLRKNMVLGALIPRDFENIPAIFGQCPSPRRV